ncbi:MAG: tyrosine-protein phosphatase [Dehalococcoidia bacterium]
MQRVLDGRIAGAVNLRDIGGYRAGDNRVRWGRVYRSGMTHTISAEGLAALTGELGVRTVIDLRTPAERRGGLLALEGVRHVHASMLDVGDDTPGPEQLERIMKMLAGSFDWAGSYVEMVQTSPEVLRTVFESLSAGETLPAVIHCTAGRDRTGVSIGLLLSLLGVAPEEIAEDYALTGDLLLPHLHQFSGFDTAGFSREDFARLVATTPAAMLMFLERVADLYGSAEGALVAAGVRPESLAAIREQLLD